MEAALSSKQITFKPQGGLGGVMQTGYSSTGAAQVRSLVLVIAGVCQARRMDSGWTSRAVTYLFHSVQGDICLFKYCWLINSM